MNLTNFKSTHTTSEVSLTVQWPLDDLGSRRIFIFHVTLSPFISRENLEIVRELGDRAAQGRACGNLGNTHYLLGNFSQAIVYHEEVRVFSGVHWLRKCSI